MAELVDKQIENALNLIVSTTEQRKYKEVAKENDT
jgi:hypothetical protein